MQIIIHYPNLPYVAHKYKAKEEELHKSYEQLVYEALLRLSDILDMPLQSIDYEKTYFEIQKEGDHPRYYGYHPMYGVKDLIDLHVYMYDTTVNIFYHPVKGTPKESDLKKRMKIEIEPGIYATKNSFMNAIGSMFNDNVLIQLNFIHGSHYFVSLKGKMIPSEIKFEEAKRVSDEITGGEVEC